MHYFLSLLESQSNQTTEVKMTIINKINKSLQLNKLNLRITQIEAKF